MGNAASSQFNVGGMTFFSIASKLIANSIAPPEAPPFPKKPLSACYRYIAEGGFDGAGFGGIVFHGCQTVGIDVPHLTRWRHAPWRERLESPDRSPDP